MEQTASTHVAFGREDRAFEDRGTRHVFTKQWSQLADLSVLGFWVVVVGFVLQHHEKWADEAQAWLLARDLPLHTLWLTELRYEGSPGLWHTILWVAQHVFHAPYAALGPIGMLFATAGTAFILWKAPFPRPIRYLLAFSYFLVYQYAVIARSYTLFPLLGFACAYLFRKAHKPESLTVALVLLSNLSAHGSVLAACLGLAYAVQQWRNWSGLDERVRKRCLLCAVVLAVNFLWIFVVLKPAADVEALHAVKRHTLNWYTSAAIGGPLFDHPLPSAMFLVLVGAWCGWRRKLLVFMLPTLLLVSLYVYAASWPHQQGTIFVAVIVALWITWPSADEAKLFSPQGIAAHRGMTAALVVLLAYQVWTAAVIIRHEYEIPYSGAADAANYLKAAGADKQRVFGFLYGMVGVQAYFDHNILANRSTAYFHHGWPPPPGTHADETELDTFRPEYVVWPCWFECDTSFSMIYEPMMYRHGYSLAHTSDGYVLSKRGWDVRQMYFIYRRNQ